MRKNDLKNAHYVGLEQRIAPRSDVYYPLPVSLPADGSEGVCTCVNISADGLLIHYDSYELALETGVAVIFDLPEIGQTSATIVWALPGKAGVQFDASISNENYDRALAAMGGPPD